jgi:PAS domain S-box-containing protein
MSTRDSQPLGGGAEKITSGETAPRGVSSQRGQAWVLFVASGAVLFLAAVMLVLHAVFAENTQYENLELAGWFLTVLLIGVIVVLSLRVRRMMDSQAVARLALAESETRFRTMADGAPVLIWLSSPDAQRQYFNKQWLTFRGREMAQEQGMGWLEGVHPDDRDACLNTYLTSSRKREAFVLEYRLRRADGEYRWILGKGTPRTEIDGTFAGFVGCCVDVTDERLATDALRAERDRHEALTALAPVGIFETDAKGHAVYLNHRWLDLAGLSREQAIGPNWARALHPEDRERVYASWYKAAESGVEFRERYRFRKPTGEVVWLNGAARPLRDDRGDIRGFIGTITDVTALVEAEERVRGSLKLQERMTERERLLLGELDHRVRNNLAGLLGVIRMHEQTAESVGDLAMSMRGAVRAMSKAHELIGTNNGAADIQGLTVLLLANLDGNTRDRVAIHGPLARIAPRQVGPLAMVLQEILTNATKHGALRPEANGGLVNISWQKGESEGKWRIRWEENGAGETRTPGRPGQGMGIIDAVSKAELRGSTLAEFSPRGVVWTIEIGPPLSDAERTAESRPRESDIRAGASRAERV